MLGQAEDLNALLEELYGAALKDARIGTGELFLEFHHGRRSWTFGTGGSKWALVDSDQQPIVEYRNDEDDIVRFTVAIGRRVVGIRFSRNPFGVRIDLEDDLAFFIIQSGEAVASDLPVFEIFMPNRRMIIMHTDGVIDDVPSDVPIPDLIASGQLHRWPTGADL